MSCSEEAADMMRNVGLCKEMITDFQIQRNGGSIILGLEVPNAVMDIVTDDATLQACREQLSDPNVGIGDVPIGRFGEYSVTLNLSKDESVSIFVDGPAFDSDRVQSSAIRTTKQSLLKVLDEAAGKGQQRAGGDSASRNTTA